MTNPEWTDNEGFIDELDIRKGVMEVHDKVLKQSISQDFVLARIDDGKKDPIIQIHSLAEYFKQQLERIAKEWRGWYWDDKKEKWIKRTCTKEEARQIYAIAERAFNTYTRKTKQLAILERNLEINPLTYKTMNQGDPTPKQGVDKILKEDKKQDG